MSHLFEQAFHLFEIMKFVTKWFVVCHSEMYVVSHSVISVVLQKCATVGALREASRASSCFGQIVLQLLVAPCLVISSFCGRCPKLIGDDKLKKKIINYFFWGVF